MIGQQILHYQIEASLGGGSMGLVYKARDLRLDRLVVLKFLRPQFSQSKEMVERFTREARAASALDHPGIATIFDVGETPDHRLFIAMAFYEGETLASLIARGPLRLEVAIDYALQLSNALAKAHKNGIVHRDLKPENVVITEDNRTKIIDFGLAKLDTAKGLTRAGVTMGTLAYMSPEQAQARGVDHRTDIWALGVMFFEMLCAKRPFPDGDAYSMMMTLMTKEPPPIRHLMPELPGWVDGFIGHALAKKTEERIPDMETFEKLLREADSKESAHQDPKTLAVDAEKIPSLVVLPMANKKLGTGGEHFAHGLTYHLIKTLSDLDGVEVIPPATSYAVGRQANSSTFRQIGAQLQVGFVVMGEMFCVGDQLDIHISLMRVADGKERWSDRYRGSVDDYLQFQSEITLAIGEHLKLQLTISRVKELVRPPTEQPKAYELYLLGRYAQHIAVPEELHRSLRFFAQAIQIDPGMTSAHAGQATSYCKMAVMGYTPGTRVLPAARKAASLVLERDPENKEALLAQSTVLVLLERNWSDAEVIYRHLFPSRPYGYEARFLLASQVLVPLGRTTEAVALLDELLAKDPFSVLAQNAKAFALWSLNRPDEALRSAVAALEVDPSSWHASAVIAMAYDQKKLFEQAVFTLKHLMATGFSNSFVSGLLAYLYTRHGMIDPARKILGEMEAMAKTQYVSAYDVAVANVGLRDAELTLSWLERACREQSSWAGYLKVDPRFNELHHHPRFQALEQQLHLVG